MAIFDSASTVASNRKPSLITMYAATSPDPSHMRTLRRACSYMLNAPPVSDLSASLVCHLPQLSCAIEPQVNKPLIIVQ
jgi:hypothetical protein